MSSADKLNKQTKTLSDCTGVLKDSPNFNEDSVEYQLAYDDFADLLDQFICEVSQARGKDAPVLSDYAVSRAGIYEGQSEYDGGTPAGTLTGLKGFAKRSGVAPNDADIVDEYTDYLLD